ncbi:T9SS type A sorting domain-containing protein [Pontibacter chinhatensis]|uniref:Por secretion system C-terminal sorting domain-containing protein n=1 Tax=Pontibacter chinhatensis TaxID=1436961 RepID=A0A1I2V4T8_9BACT|nr:T9SS type A sorting domain-containing protein [Pontibacter chinhatensis]SFG84242.1 Por secretion system C-terminal sorting domain-containing protein [Pontibacter chinhatensis]
MKTKLLLSVLAILLLPVMAQATHIKSGYISYTRDAENPRKFDFTLTVYTHHFSSAEDPEVSMFMGDGNKVVVPRVSVTKYSSDLDVELFQWSYTYDTPGLYTVAWIGENRDHNILNIQGSSDIYSFYVSTTVNVNPLNPNRHGIQLAGIPILDGYAGQPIKHNFAAFDADNNKLTYKLVTPKKASYEYIGIGINAPRVVDIPGFRIPDGLTINEHGELNWNAPASAGRYTIAVEITEHWNGVAQGTTLVDISIIIADPEQNLQPQLELLNKAQLALDEKGALRLMPGQTLKLNYFMRRHLGNDFPVKTKLYSELDTLELTPIHITTRDSAGGWAITVAITPGEALVREQAYILAMSALLLSPLGGYYYKNNTDWEFTYVYVGNAQPTAADDELKKAGFILYPNPVADKFVVEAPDMPGMFVHLYDATGKRAGALRLQPGKNHFTKPASLSNGLYFYTIYSRHKPVGTGKMVVR